MSKSDKLLGTLDLLVLRILAAGDAIHGCTIADQIHVSAISLGDPRMAIINGRLVGEGEEIILHPPGTPVPVSLRLKKISDGEVELSDGVQVIKARLELAPASKRKR